MTCLWCGDETGSDEHLCRSCKGVDGAVALLARLYHSDGDEELEEPERPAS